VTARLWNRRALVDYAIAAAVAALEADARSAVAMRALEERHVAGTCTPSDHFAYRTHWLTATFRRSPAMRARMPVTVDHELCHQRELIDEVRSLQARLAVEAAFRSSPEGEAPTAAHR
jgi:hypothetical protein